MNKIYKVIWSKVKHQYVVVSELAHSNGKQSRTSRNSIRSRIAALVVCGAIAAFGVFSALPTSSAFAAGAEATAGQYIAIGGANSSDGYYDRNTRTYYKYYTGSDNKQHKYIFTKTNQGNFWVREGYTIDIVNNPRFGGDDAGDPDKEIIINTYKGEGADSEGLVQSYQNVQESMNISTLNGDKLFSTGTAMYGGAVNTSSTQVTTGEEYIINEGKTAVKSNNIGQYFHAATYNEKTGLYSYKGKVVSNENLYVISGQVGVFTTTANGNEVYTGDVYGRNNEILMTGVKENGDYVSYWGAEVVDPNATIGSMTVSTLQGKFDEVDSSIEKIHKDDIKQIQVASATNGGTIGLQTNGEFNEDGTAKGGANIPGTITVTSEGGTGGSGKANDVKIKFASENGGSFTVDAGSKVEAVQGQNDKISAIKINGQQYNLGTGGTITGSFNTQTGEISVEQDGQSVLAGRVHDWKVTSANLDNNGTLTIGSTDTYNEANTNSVTVNNVASRGYVTNQINANNTTITQQYENYFNTNDKYLSGATFDNNSGELKLTVAKAGENGAAQEYSFDLGKYVEGKDVYVNQISIDKDNNKLILNRKNATPLELGLEELSDIGVSSTDYQLVANPTNGSGGKYTVDDNGNLTLTVEDKNNPGNTEDITITGLAKKTDVAVVHDSDKSLRDTNAQIWDERTHKTTEKSSSIALGNGAFVSVQDGNKANAVLFDSDTYTGGIAIGENSKALNATVNIGVKDYEGKMGDVNLSGDNKYKTYEAMGTGETSVGSNSYISGSLSTNIGSYNVITTKYMNGGNSLDSAQNFGSITVGTLNSIESNSSSSNIFDTLGGKISGVANSVVGMANKTQNSNGSLVFGTGNEITNSIDTIPTPSSVSGDVADVAENFRDAVSDRNKSNGGAVLAIGGGNKADYAQNSQLIGVQNEVTGTSKDISEFNMVNGYQNTVTNGSNDTVIGTKNTVTNGDSNVVLGDNHTVQDADNNVILGSSDKVATQTASNTVVIGYNAQANSNNDVAIGSGSVANGAVGTEGYAGANPIGTVSVGSEGNERTITNVAAGRIDATSTDAVNGSQLYDVQQEAGKHTTIQETGKNVTVKTNGTTDGHLDYTVDLNDDVTLDGNIEDSNKINLSGTEGTIDVVKANGSTNINGGIITVSSGTGEGSKAIKIDGTTAEITGLSNTTLGDGSEDSTFAKVGRAATEEQLQAAMTKIDEGSYKGWKVSAEGGKASSVASGKTVDFSGAEDEDGNSNITVTKTTGEDGNTQLAFGLSDDLNVTNITANNMYVTNTDGTKDNSVVNVGYFNANERHIMPTTGGGSYAATEDGTVTLNYADGEGNLIEGTTAKITGLASDKELSDAAAAAKTEVTGGKNITVGEPTTASDGHSIYTVDLADNVYLGGDNTPENSNITLDGTNGVIEVGSNIALDGRGTAVIGGVNIDTAYDEATGKPSSTITGLSNQNVNYNGFADGSGRAATEEQLKSVSDKAASSHTAVTVNGGTKAGNAPDYSDGNLQLSQTKDKETGKITYDVKLNDNITLGDKESSSINLNGNNGSIALTNSKGETAVTINNEGIVVNNSMGNNGDGADVISYDYDGDHGYMGSKVGKNSLNEIGYNTQDVSYNYTRGTTTIGNVNITRVNDPTNAANANKVILNTAGNNLVIRASGSVETKDDVIAKGMVQAGDVTVNADDSGLVEGLTNTTWTDEIATAAADKKSEAAGTAATQGQLGDVASDLSDQITNSGWTASTNNGAVTTNITNGDKVDFANTDGNIAVNQTAVKDDKGNITGTNLTFDLKPDITLDDDVEDGNSVQLSGTNGTINAHNSELIFGGTGKYDNVNDMTFNQNGLTITNTQTMRDTGETTTSSTVINGGSIATGNITAGGITVNADNGGTVNGLTNKTWDADNYVSGQAATEDQLKSVSDKVNAGWIATDNNGNQITVNPKDNTLNFSGDRNVTVTANKEDGSIDVALNNEVQLGDFDNGTGVYLSGASGTISATNSISVGMDQGLVIDGNKKTINGLSNTTWDPENYVSGQAATEDQLQEAAAASKTTLSNGTNTNVTSTEKADGHIDYQVNLNKNINLNDRVYINGDPVEGNNTIIDIKSGDTSKEESIFAVEDKGNGSISIGGIDVTNVDGPYLAVGDGKLKFYKDGGLATGNETGTFSVRPDGDLEISGKNSSFNVDAETGNVNAVNSSGSAIMMNDDSVALNASGNGVAISDEGILLNTNGIDEDIKLVTKGTSVSVDNDGATFTNTNTNETTNIDGGTINVGDRLMVEEDGSIYATNNNGSTVMINDNGVALNSEGNGVVVSGEGITLNTNGSAVTVDRFNGATFTNTNTTESTNINGANITAGEGENQIKINGAPKADDPALSVGTDKFVVGQDGSLSVSDKFNVDAETGNVNAINSNGSAIMMNDDSVALNASGNGVVISDEGITLNTNGSAVTVDRFNGATFTNTNTGETTNINGDIITTDTVKGLSNTTWDDELATQVANSEELQGTAATQGQLQQAVSAVATEAAKQHTTVSGDDNLTVKSSVNENGGTNYQVTLDDDITLGNPKAGNTEGERSFTINTTDPNGYIPESYAKPGSGADFIEENGGFMLFATDTQGHGIFGVTAKGSAWAKDFKTYTTDIYGNNTQYSLNDVGDAVAQMSSYYNKENGKSYTVFSRYLNEAEKDKPFETVDKNATRDIPLALRDDGAVLIGATIKGDDFTDNGIRINAETETTYDENGKEVTNNVATITGLENTTWTPPAPVATFANEGTETSRAATEAQLNDLYSTVVGYNVDTNGVNYGTVTLGGGRTSYDQDTHEGGTVLNNVAYASGTDGSEAVNVDYLKDTINKAVEAGGSISNSDKHLVANTAEGSNGVYKPNAEGNVNLIVSDEKGNSSTVTIGDVASKTELDSLKTNVGDLNYDKVTGDKLVNGDSVTTAIGKLDNKIDNISGTATDAANNTVTGGTIKDDGTISLTQKDGDTVALDGKLTDSGVVQDGTKFDGETGTLTITSQDKYNKGTSK